MKKSEIHSQEHMYFTSDNRFNTKLQQNENSGVADLFGDEMQRK